MLTIGIVLLLLFSLAITILLINNKNMNERIYYLENTIKNNYLASLIQYENMLIIDEKGYFRSDDYVGINFNLLLDQHKNIIKYLDELDINIDDELEIQKRIINIDRMLSNISEIEKEERLFKLINKGNNSKKLGKTYFKK
jgi:hypothetical protein